MSHCLVAPVVRRLFEFRIVDEQAVDLGRADEIILAAAGTPLACLNMRGRC